ncbi:MAG: TrkH family potassium uptake protein [Clostridia bacterium]|nr:TrkH family potassium uptake protein [Clostridia bacterium]
MNRSLILFFTGRLIRIVGLLMLLPLLVSAIYKENCFCDFLIVIILSLILGQALVQFFKPKDSIIYAREGFIIVALSWLICSALGALPFYISGEIATYTDAFFETVSGFTTTGASILTDIESMSKGLLFWRSFTHWIGGMGILVLIVALFPGVSDRSIHILKAEMPGPIMGKLLPRLKDTAKILYLIYLVLTVVEIILLLAGGMSLYDSVVHAFGTAGTGGFGIKSDSVAGYSPYIQWVITIFMLVFGVNFNLYFLLLRKRFGDALRSGEFLCYFGIITVSVGVITANIASMYPTIGESFRHGAFQVASIISTTGYATTDFDLWPSLSKAVLLILMFTGACAGSTAGGLKISRVMILFKSAKRELSKLLHPRSVGAVKFEGKALDNTTLANVRNYFSLYMFCLFGLFLLISFEPMSLETNFTAVISCFNNVGPGFGGVGPVMSYALYTPFTKWVLSFAMLLGRLEIFPLLLALAPATWRKSK